MVKSQQMSQLSHAQFPLRRHPHLLVDHRRAGIASVGDSRERTPCAVTGSGGRLHFGTVAGFKTESVAGLNRNSHCVEEAEKCALVAPWPGNGDEQCAGIAPPKASVD